MITTTLEQSNYREREMTVLNTINHFLNQIISTVKNGYASSKGQSKFVRLPNHMLNDIGLTREEAYEVVGKSNWQDHAISQGRRFWQER
jgi:uncharacterized protein YjiS (DUF1127 family)